jgi:hypothetical protein
VHHHLEVEPAPADVLPQVSGGGGFLDGRLEDTDLLEELAAHVHERPVAPHGVGAAIMPSKRRCGSFSRMKRSVKVPGSPSSPLTTRYTGLPLEGGMKDHFIPVGNPAPSAPLEPEAFTVSVTSFGDMAKSLGKVA